MWLLLTFGTQAPSSSSECFIKTLRMKMVGKQIPNRTAQQRRRPASSIRQNLYKYDNLRTPCHFQWVVRQISRYTSLLFATLSLSVSMRSKAGIIVSLRAFKWALRRTHDYPPPAHRVCFSNTHVSRGKFSNEYSATLADKVIIKKKVLWIFSLL